jgi:hypothetical protein
MSGRITHLIRKTQPEELAMTRNVEHFSPKLIDPPLADYKPRALPELPVEAAFLTYRHNELRLDTSDHAEELKAHFAHAVVRNPRNLLLHVQRILLYAETGDPAILSALCDLFLVLQEKGTPLRRRLLALARPLLKQDDFQALHRLLSPAESDTSTLRPNCAWSRLSDGVTGTTELITKLTPKAATSQDPLETARQQLEVGQAELAQKTLETALLADPIRLALHLALLEIYRHTRDLHHIDSFWRTLPKAQNPAASQWQRLIKHLEEEL